MLGYASEAKDVVNCANSIIGKFGDDKASILLIYEEEIVRFFETSIHSIQCIVEIYNYTPL